VKITIDQPNEATPAQAEAAFLDPAFYAGLGELEGISAPEVRSFSSQDGHARMVLGYRFAGQLTGVARSILDPGKLTWAQETDVDLATGRTEVRMVPDNYASLLSFAGWYELRPADGGLCSQHFEVDLRVRIPLLGPLAERTIADSIRQNVADTAGLVGRYVAAQRAAGDKPVRKTPRRRPAAGRAQGGDEPAT
jgi:hypothetical protein